ncbi:odorant receptor 49b-like [Diorhabda carinulata]|uniref:odorant receptor 49b-like n=1 Tax=Diorhabda carinulata TaxID=1163345 RepID=UPI0025A16767|nr:odorant receptor 49b-like [Diorhabda carinulata]
MVWEQLFGFYVEVVFLVLLTLLGVGLQGDMNYNEVDDYREQTMFHTRLLCCTLYITLAVICLFANLVWYIADADNEFYEAFNPYLNKTSLYKKSAFEIYLPFDTSNDGYIWLAFFIQYYSKLISVQMFIPFEILLTSFIIHLISQTMVVAEAFKHIHKHISPKQTAGRKFLIIEMRIIKCINELQEIYSAFNLVDAVCSVQMLIQYGCAILILCILCYMAPMLEKAGEIFGCVMFLIASLGEIFFFSYCSQTLTLELQKVAISIYGIQWETYPLKVQKHIKFLLKRLQKPAVLKAGKMFPIDLNFFNLILQKAYSFYTIINARQ